MDQNSHQSPDLSMPTAAAIPQSQPQGAMPQPAFTIPAEHAGTPSQAAPADDAETSDLDQDWINKARDLVEKTKNDPFAQAQELNKLKSGYLKVRYNKEIKVDEHKTQ